MKSCLAPLLQPSSGCDRSSTSKGDISAVPRGSGQPPHPQPLCRHRAQPLPATLFSKVTYKRHKPLSHPLCNRGASEIGLSSRLSRVWPAVLQGRVRRAGTCTHIALAVRVHICRHICLRLISHFFPFTAEKMAICKKKQSPRSKRSLDGGARSRSERALIKRGYAGKKPI